MWRKENDSYMPECRLQTKELDIQIDNKTFDNIDIIGVCLNVSVC